MKWMRTLSTIFFSLILLTACGGGGSNDENNPSDGIPEAVIDAPNEVPEGTTTIDIDGSNSTDDSEGTLSTYLWAIEDNGGITNLEIADSAGVTTQVINLPETLDDDITVTISLIVTDDEDNDSPKVTKSITLANDVTIIVNTGSFDGTWNSPCFDTTNKTSIEQTITINGTSMTGDVKVYSAGATPAFGCVLPASSTGLITAQTDSNLSYGSQTGVANCVNGQAVNTSIGIASITVGAQTANTEEDINGVTRILSFSDGNVLPPSTDMCLLSNGNLLYGGYEYTPASPN